MVNPLNYFIKIFKVNIHWRDIIGFIISLLVAFAIWLLNNLSQDYTTNLELYIKVESNISGRELRCKSPVKYIAKCRNSGFKLVTKKRINPNNPIIITIPNSELYYEGGDIFSVTSEQLGRYISKFLGYNIISKSNISEKIFLNFPKEYNKKVPVVPNIKFSCKPQYMLIGKLNIEPDSIYIYGENVDIDKINEIETLPINLKDLEQPYTSNVELKMKIGVRYSQQEVEYNLNIGRYVETTFKVPVHIINIPFNTRVNIYPPVAKLRIRQSFPPISQLEKELSVFIDYQDFINSEKGSCIGKVGELPIDVYSCEIYPKVFDCVKVGK